ncbi:MAG: chitobiase/beta-hexosaminidase C-terminal domain-containing protein, partial [Bryobacteraceae bacterium]
AVATATYTLRAATPTFAPAAGTYSSARSVVLSDASPGVTVYYTTNGSTPTTASTPYAGGIPVTATITIKAIAAATGWTSSAVATAAYTLRAATPTFSPAAGTFGAPQSVVLLDASPGVTIYYTTNGSTPTTSSTSYTGPIPVSATTTIKAIAVATGWTSSAVASAAYTLRANAPTFGLAAGTYTGPQSIALSDTSPGVTIYYTTNGNNPTTASTPYSGPIPVTATTTVKAIAAATGWTSSSVVTAKYTIQ